MPILLPDESSNYERPPAGLHNAVCVAVEDLGLVEVEYNGEKKVQPKIHIYWQIDERTSEGKRHDLRKRYTLTSDDRGTLKADLESWRGAPFRAGEMKGFDVEKLVGVPCSLQVVHEESKKGKTYANVKAVLPYDSRLGQKLAPEEFTLPQPREKQTPQQDSFGGPFTQQQQQPETVPF